MIRGRDFAKQLTEELYDLVTDPHRVWESVLSNVPEVTISKTLNISSDDSPISEIYKAEGIVDAPVSVTFNALYNLQTQEWDEYCRESTIVEEFDVNNQIVYLKYGTAFPSNSSPRDFCLFRTFTIFQRNKEKIIVFRSVEHEKAPPKEGVVRADVWPSGFYFTHAGEDKTKLIIISQCCMHIKPKEKKFFTQPMQYDFFSARIIPILNRNIQIQMSSGGKKFLSSLELMTFKEVYHTFASLEESENFKILTADENVRVYLKQEGLGTFSCCVGFCRIDVHPQKILDYLMENTGELLSEEKLIEQIDERRKITLVTFDSIIHPSGADSVVFKSARISPDGVYMLTYRSITHKLAPPKNDTLRLEVAPSGYFIHPLRGNKSLVSYCIQVDLRSYIERVDQFNIDSFAKISMIRMMHVMNNLRNLGPSEKTLEKSHCTSDAASRFELISKMCILYLKQNDEKEKKRRRLNRLKELEDALANQSMQTETNGDFLPIQTVLSVQKRVFSSSFQYEEKSFAFCVTRKEPLQRKSYNCCSSFFELLPDELLLHLLKFVDHRILCTLSQVNRRLNFLASDRTLWKRLYKVYFRTRNKKKTNNDEDVINSNWKRKFREEYVLQYNFHCGRYKKINLGKHDKPITQIVCNEEIAITSSVDRFIKVWDLKNGHLAREIFGPSSGTLSLQLEQNEIVCGYKNGALRSWNIENGECIFSKQFGFWSEGFLFLPEIIVSWEDTIDLWERSTGQHLVELSEHQKKITTLISCNNFRTLISGSADKTLKKWDIETHLCSNTLVGHGAKVTCIDSNDDGTSVVSGGNDKQLFLWDVRKNMVVSRIRAHGNGIMGIKVLNDLVFSYSSDAIRAWDLRRFDKGPLYDLDIHQNQPTCFSLNSRSLITGDRDGSVVEFNFNFYQSK